MRLFAVSDTMRTLKRLEVLFRHPGEGLSHFLWTSSVHCEQRQCKISCIIGAGHPSPSADKDTFCELSLDVLYTFSHSRRALNLHLIIVHVKCYGISIDGHESSVCASRYGVKSNFSSHRNKQTNVKF